jgi:hypothetical protein
MPAMTALVRQAKSTYVGFQSLFVFLYSLFDLIPLDMEIPEKLVHFRINSTTGINGGHYFECVVDHLEPIMESSKEKLNNRVLRVL